MHAYRPSHTMISVLVINTLRIVLGTNTSEFQDSLLLRLTIGRNPHGGRVKEGWVNQFRTACTCFRDYLLLLTSSDIVTINKYRLNRSAGLRPGQESEERSQATQGLLSFQRGPSKWVWVIQNRQKWIWTMGWNSFNIDFVWQSVMIYFWNFWMYSGAWGIILSMFCFFRMVYVL